MIGMRLLVCALSICAWLSSAETAEDWVRQGRELKAKGDAASALHAFERAASLDPKSAGIEDEIGFLLALYVRNEGQFEHQIGTARRHRK